MTESYDLKLNCEVRRVLVKHYVDLGRIAVRSQKGRVTIFGHLQRVIGAQEPLTSPIVEVMFYEIGRLRLASKVNVRLDNWTVDGGRWKPMDRVDIEGDTTTVKKKAAIRTESSVKLRSGHKPKAPGER